MKSSNYDQIALKKPTLPNAKEGPQALRLLVSIIDRGKGERVARLLERHGSLHHTILLGRGTARKDLLNYLGLGESEKDVVLSGIPQANAPSALRHLMQAMQFEAPGRGIAFTIPISSVSGKRALSYLSGNYCVAPPVSPTDPVPPTDEEREVPPMVQFEHSLIFSIVNRGFTDLVVDGALKAGAKGGTVLNARGAGLEEASKFFGISIVPEKEVVLILVKAEEKNKVMKAIIDSSGLSTPAHGLSFSVPVDSAAGMARMMMEDFED